MKKNRGSMLIEAMIALLIMTISVLIVGVSVAPIFRFSKIVQCEMDMIDIALSEAEKALNDKSTVSDISTLTINEVTYKIDISKVPTEAYISGTSTGTVGFDYLQATISLYSSCTSFGENLTFKVVPAN